MINKFAKAQKSWVAKFILTLTALSFMSLFGVTGYINSAGQNRTVIKVDNLEISQAQFSHSVQKDFAEARKLIGTDVEFTEEMQTALIMGQVQKTVQNLIIDRTAQKYDVAFRPELLQSFILNNPSFKDASGQFNRTLFNRMLSDNNLSESDVFTNLKRNLTRRLLVEMPVSGVHAPQALTKALAQIDNKRRTFRYIEINPENITIPREIPQEDMEQYYEDFNSSFIEGERRDITLLYLTIDNIADKMEITPEDIAAYYEEHKDDYETPQTRQLLQMMFDNEESANAAYDDLQKGLDFYAVASDKAKQTKEDTELGYTAENELPEELANEAFSLEIGHYTQPIEIGQVWQILKVTDIKQGSKQPYDKVSAEIADILKSENLYTYMYDLSNDLADKRGNDTSLEELAEDIHVSLYEVKALGEDGTVTSADTHLKSLFNDRDFVEEVFTYTTGETSQVVETEEGLALFRVNEIYPAHPKDISEVKDEIIALWSQDEKAAIMHDMLNDINHDLENGDDITEVGKRYGLPVYRTQPITRNETFSEVSFEDIREMFADPLNTPHQIELKNKFLVAVADNDYKNSVPLSEEELALVQFSAVKSLTRDFTNAMLNGYADDYKIRVKYKLLGIED